MAKAKDMFFGRLVWGCCTDWARDNDEAGSEWFRSWDELHFLEQERYQMIGESLLSYFRNIEGSEVLKIELAKVREEFERFKADVLKERKQNGGR